MVVPVSVAIAAVHRALAPDAEETTHVVVTIRAAKEVPSRPRPLLTALLVLDASLPGGLIDGSGNLAYAQTMTFTTLMMFQLFNVLNARSDERSAFGGIFANHWLWAAIGLSLVLHAAVIYVPFLQQAFSTTALSAGDWLLCAAVASSVLWLRELSKLLARATSRDREP